jgi:hypothetical protein
MTGSVANQVHDAGEELVKLAQTPGTNIGQALNGILNRFLSWPFRAAAGSATDSHGQNSKHFATLVYTSSHDSPLAEPVDIPADALACIIDVSEDMSLEQFRAAYRRVASGKSLKKSPVPHLKGVPHTTVTLGIIFTVRTELPMECLAEELDCLNRNTPSVQWPDMVVVLSKGTINYAVQFPGESPTGDYLPPAEGSTLAFTPPMYIVLVIKPAGTHTLNKMFAFLLAHLAIFSPGASLPNWAQVLEGTPKEVMTFGGYQYNLSGQLVPVPKEFHEDRYLSPRPVHIEDRQGGRLATLQFLPWQDGGVVLLMGKLPLEGLLVFLGKKALERGGIVRRGDRQLSYALPITRADFGEMLNRIQKQSNMIVRADPTSFVVQKLADEGSSSPFMARLFIGNLRLRDAVFPDPAKRQDFDKAYEFVLMTLLNTRRTAQDIKKLFDEHAQKVANGEVARVQGQTLYIDENIDKELRKQMEDFLNSAIRILKYGMQDVTKTLQVNIGFLFKKPGTFASGVTALQVSDADLAEYLQQTRQWSERLVECRNAMEHTASVLPRVKYSQTSVRARAEEPHISGQPVSEFAEFMIDRLACFVEEVTAHCLQKYLPASLALTELPLPQREPEMPERFRLTLRNGGKPVWVIAYHQSTFNET